MKKITIIIDENGNVTSEKQSITKENVIAYLEDNRHELEEILYGAYYDKEYKFINLTELDFMPYECDVDISQMKVKGNLWQNCQTVEGSLGQNKQKVKGKLWQNYQNVKGKLYQDNQVSNEETTIKYLKDNKESLAKLLYSAYYEEYNNCIDLRKLDFTPYECNVDISQMKVKGSLFQNSQDVKNILWQDFQTVEGNLWQDNQNVKGDLYQNSQKVKGYLKQNFQTVEGNLWQGGQNVEGSLWQNHQKVKGDLRQNKQNVKGKLYQDNLESDKDD